jgi:putative transposase
VTKRCGRNYHQASLLTASKRRRGEGTIWQRRYWEHVIRDQEDMHRFTDYLHYNPVKHSHVSTVAEWPYSTFHRFVWHGLYPEDWGGSGSEALDGKLFGE